VIGRTNTLAAVSDILKTSKASGRTVLVEGDPGIGKTTLLDLVAHEAADEGFHILRCSAVDTDATVGFAALHELLHPLLGLVEALPLRQRQALLSAFGLAEDDAVPDRLLLSLGALGLLEEGSSKQPLAVLVDDLQWIDRSSTDVIEFMTRRLIATPLAIIATVRSEHAAEVVGFNASLRLHLGPLTLEESVDLLNGLGLSDARARSRVLSEASGNPLALSEFAKAISAYGLDAVPLRGPLLTTERLEDAFLSQITALPTPSRTLLLMAAADQAMPLPRLLTAAADIGIRPEDLKPVEQSALIVVAGDRLRFRHPLIRSAIYGAASQVERSAVHRALAGRAVGDDAIWHSADAASGLDEPVAASLEELGQRARSRGADAEAAAALTRSATLSESPDGRLRRWLEAAEAARLAGLQPQLEHAVAEAEPLATDHASRSSLALTRSMVNFAIGSPADYAYFSELFDYAYQLGGPSGTEYVEERLGIMVMVAFQAADGYYDDEFRRQVAKGLSEINLGRVDPLQQIALTMLEPAAQAHIRHELPTYVDMFANIPSLLLAVAQAAERLQDLPAAHRAWQRAADSSRTLTGRGDECHALNGLAKLQALTGEFDTAMSTAEQVRRMASDISYPLIEADASATIAGIQVWAGDHETASGALAHARALNTSTVPQVAASVAWGSGMLASAQGDPHRAWTALQQVHDYPVIAQWAIADLAEVAVTSGHVVEFHTVLERMEDRTRSFDAPDLTALIERSKALCASGMEAVEHFENAIQSGQKGVRRVEVARTHVLYSSWLRKHRNPGAARDQLSTGYEQARAMGATNLVAQIARALRADGVNVPEPKGPTTSPVSMLTPQEKHVAQLAAEGLTNKEIADRIYLSHRTVSTHLSNAYAKLGIRSRVQLEEVLGGRLTRHPR
jgi:DNA-binding CsgD family transcriptional regulator